MLVQVMGVNDMDSYVMTVAASPDQNPAAIADAVNNTLSGVSTL